MLFLFNVQLINKYDDDDGPYLFVKLGEVFIFNSGSNGTAPCLASSSTRSCEGTQSLQESGSGKCSGVSQTSGKLCRLIQLLIHSQNLLLSENLARSLNTELNGICLG